MSTMNGIEVKIIADSMNPEGYRLTTFQLRYHRFIHSELLTHRNFSRNSSSSRAIPVKKMLELIANEPATPLHFGKNQAGMQAKEELEGSELEAAKSLWLEAARNASDVAEKMLDIGLHKQVANRILEPFQFMQTVLTATEFDNFFELRDHPDAQPEIAALARMMKKAMQESTPHLLLPGEWHLPYITEGEKLAVDAELLKKVSVARCCRVSYLKHDGSNACIEEDLLLCERLAGSVPKHCSPFEHQGTPDYFCKEAKFGGSDEYSKPWLHGNFKGWIQYRKLIE